MGRLSRFGEGPLQGDVTVAVAIEASAADDLIKWHCDVVDATGRMRLRVDDGEAWIDAKLKRLSGGWAGGVPAGAEA
jgi:hypothetical protein